MHRVSRQSLQSMVVVSLATAPPLVKSKLRSKRPVEADEARKALAEAICARIDNDSYMVVVTEMIGEAHKAYRGKWDVDEPAPAVVPVPPPPPSSAEA